MFDSLNNVTALLFSENPKEPALIISSFRKDTKGEKPELKAAFINGDIYTGDNNLVALTKIKTKNELIGEVIGLLQSPAKTCVGSAFTPPRKRWRYSRSGSTRSANCGRTCNGRSCSRIIVCTKFGVIVNAHCINHAT